MADHSKTIFRTVKKENPYVQIDKTVLNDARLSWKAKGLMAFLLSKPDHWEINVKNLIKQAKDGKEAVYSGINELITFGYIVRAESRHKGRFSQIVYLIYENPQMINLTSAAYLPEFVPSLESPSKTPLPGNPDTVKPETDFPDTENPPQVINDLSVKNDPKQDPPLNPPPIREGTEEDQPDFHILEPIALKFFGQSNDDILYNLRSKIKEFKLDPDVVQECLHQIDVKAIKFNPYGYFRGIYTTATARVIKRKQALERQYQLAELMKDSDSINPGDTEEKSTGEVIADIRRMLGIVRNTKDPAHEPN